MAVFYSYAHLPEFTHAVITIGAFDGVHQGHVTILQELVRRAKECNGESIVITFDPHPRKLLYPEQPLQLLTPLSEKIKLITAQGIDHIVVVPFSQEFACLSASKYVEDFLVKNFHPQCIVIGYDHRFGHDRAGNIDLLKSLQATYGFEVQEIPVQLVKEAAISSTKIRNALLEGNVKTAAMMMGRPYALLGTVVEGRHLGNTIGFPTANLRLLDEDQLIPANGVYAVKVKLGEDTYGGMLNIGFRPTVAGGDPERHIEAHIFNFSQDIYAKEVTLYCLEKMREEHRFPSIEALKEQLEADKVEALKILKQAKY